MSITSAYVSARQWVCFSCSAELRGELLACALNGLHKPEPATYSLTHGKVPIYSVTCKYAGELDRNKEGTRVIRERTIEVYLFDVRMDLGTENEEEIQKKTRTACDLSQLIRSVCYEWVGCCSRERDQYKL